MISTRDESCARVARPNPNAARAAQGCFTSAARAAQVLFHLEMKMLRVLLRGHLGARAAL